MAGVTVVLLAQLHLVKTGDGRARREVADAGA